MRKFKSLLAILLCLSLIQVPAVSIVSASTMNTENIITLDEDTNMYNSLSAASAWEKGAGTTTDFVQDEEDGYLTVLHTSEKVLNDAGTGALSSLQTMVRRTTGGVIAENTDNRTSVTAGSLNGKYQVDITFEAQMLYAEEYPNEDGTIIDKLPVPYYDLGLHTGNSRMVFVRLRPTGGDFMNNAASNEDTVVGSKPALDIRNGAEHTVTFVIDTVGGTVEGYADGDTSKKESGPLAVTGPLTKIEMIGLSRILTGSYFKFKNIKITQLEAAANASLDAQLASLPEKLAEDVNDVTADVTVPEVSGVTWSSSNEAAMTADGKVTRIKGVAQEVTLTASFTIGDVAYSMNYDMTVAPADNVVTFMADGEAVAVQEVRDGQTAAAVSAPEKTGHTFQYWYAAESPDTAYDFNTPLYDHLTLYAKYEPNPYTITFMVDGEEVATRTGKYGSPIEGTLPEIPEKPGYTAIGWGIGDTTVLFGAATPVEGDTTVNAIYVQGTPARHTVTFTADGETVDTQQVYDGFTAVMPATVPVKEHYIFKQWTLNGAAYDFAALVHGDLTIEAEFDPEPVAVTFYDEDWTTVLHNGTGYYNLPYGDLPESPSKEGGFRFAGWYTSGGEQFTSDTVVTEPLSVAAAYQSTRIVLLDDDLTRYSTMSQAVGWAGNNNSHLVTGIDPNGGIRMTQIASTPGSGAAANSAQETALGAVLTGILEQDDANRTNVSMTRFSGLYELELQFDYKWEDTVYPDDYTGTKPGNYAVLQIGSSAEDNPLGSNIGPITFRLNKTNIRALNSGSVATDTMLPKDKSYPVTAGQTVALHIQLDTANQQVTAWCGDDESQAVTGKFYSSASNFNALLLKTQQRFGVGSYIRFTRVKLTQLDVDTEDANYVAAMDTLSQLPASLAANPNRVTGNLSIPAVEGVSWTSSNPTIVQTDGTVSRWYDDYEVTVTATVAKGNYMFKKNYSLTVAARDGIEKVVKMDESYTSENDLANWTFRDVTGTQEGRYSVDGSGVKVEKVTPSADMTTTKEKKSYYAYLDLYGTETAYSAETGTETLAKDYQGVYDVSFSSLASVTSTAPATVALGYRLGTQFYSAGMFKYANGGLTFVCNPTLETTGTVEIATSVSGLKNLTLRIDTVNQQLWVFDGDTLLTNDALSFYNLFPSGTAYKFNALRVGLDTNNGAGDYVQIGSARVTQLERTALPEQEAALQAAEGLTMDAVTDSPASLSGYLKQLPETLEGGYGVTWSANTDQIDMQTREVFHSEAAVDAVISAYIESSTAAYPSVVRKDFHVTIRAAANDEELTKYQLNSIGKITEQPYDDIRYDLNLPYIDGVVWTSSNPDIIANDGTLNESLLLSADTPVTISASKNGISKEYPLTVAKRAPLEMLYTGDTISEEGILLSIGAYTNLKVTGDTISTIRFTKSAETGTISFVDASGAAALAAEVTDTGIRFDYLGSAKEEYALSDGAEATVRVQLMPKTGRAAIWLNGTLVADYVPVQNNATDLAGFTTTNSSLGVTGVDVQADAYAMLQINVDNLDYFSVLDTGYTNTDVTLLTDTVTGAAAEWISSNEALISNTGAVTHPDMITFATVTLKLTDAANPAIFETYSKTIAVDCDASRNIASKAALTVSALENISRPKEHINDNDIASAYEMVGTSLRSPYIIFDFGSAVSFNTFYVNEAAAGIENYTIETSNDGTNWTTVKTGAITDVASRLIHLDSIASARYVRFTVEQCAAESVYINEIKMYLIADAAELAEIDLSLLTLDRTSTTTDIPLPASGVNGTAFTWTSSNSAVITADGKVTRPTYSTTVTLTASAAGTSSIKQFNIYVEGTAGSAGPDVVPGGSGSGGSGSTNTSASANNGFIGSVNPGTVFNGDSIQSGGGTTGTSYSDVAKDAWYYEAVESLTEQGVVNGDGTGRFNPDAPVTREQFVKMLLLATDTELLDVQNPFEDVDTNEWYSPYVLTAKEQGIVKGITDTVFGIGTNIVRQDMAVLIARLLEQKGYETEQATELFADDQDIAAYARDAVYAIKNLGLINGYNGAFNPTSSLTRAESAQVIASLIELLQEPAEPEETTEAETEAEAETETEAEADTEAEPDTDAE